ncbi:Sec-independent protein translocase family protein [Flindersiella endophytica]
MPSIGTPELIIIGIILVVLFGATRLPKAAAGIGQALKIFKKEIRDEDKPAEVAPTQQQATVADTAPAQAQAAPVSQANGTAPAQSAKDPESAK